jgi:hypothetical protein
MKWVGEQAGVSQMSVKFARLSWHLSSEEAFEVTKGIMRAGR